MLINELIVMAYERGHSFRYSALDLLSRMAEPRVFGAAVEVLFEGGVGRRSVEGARALARLVVDDGELVRRFDWPLEKLRSLLVNQVLKELLSDDERVNWEVFCRNWRELLLGVEPLIVRWALRHGHHERMRLFEFMRFVPVHIDLLEEALLGLDIESGELSQGLRVLEEHGGVSSVPVLLESLRWSFDCWRSGRLGAEESLVLTLWALESIGAKNQGQCELTEEQQALFFHLLICRSEAVFGQSLRTLEVFWGVPLAQVLIRASMVLDGGIDFSHGRPGDWGERQRAIEAMLSRCASRELERELRLCSDAEVFKTEVRILIWKCVRRRFEGASGKGFSSWGVAFQGELVEQARRLFES